MTIQYIVSSGEDCFDEISKMFEETVCGNATELTLHFTKKEPKGEFVVVIDAIA